VNIKPSLTNRIEGIDYLSQCPIAINISDGKIQEIERINQLSGKDNNTFISPGLIDIQVNGYNSVSFSLDGLGKSIKDTDELTSDKIKKVTEALWKEGVTTYFPTLTTNSQDLLKKNFSVLAKAMEDSYFMGSIPGYHLEGPYISKVDGYRGAHPKEYVRNPDWDEFLELYNAADRNILLVTLAPEIDGALEFIKKCRQEGVVVSLGHHNGSAEIIKKAIDSGARLSTHLGNGCAGMIKRHDNPLWPQLADDRLMISIIADGFHLPPEVLQVFYKVKGSENIIITSDVSSYAGMPAGKYKIKTGETIEKTSEGNLIFSGGGLYGSASLLSRGVGHIMKVTGCTLGEAIQMTVTNPAFLHNLNDRGKLEPGKRADIILFEMEEYKMKIRKTFVKGKLVYQSENS
jgi:N-acetylglucosamine-6-phosphate deacetylase